MDVIASTPPFLMLTLNSLASEHETPEANVTPEMKG